MKYQAVIHSVMTGAAISARCVMALIPLTLRKLDYGSRVNVGYPTARCGQHGLAKANHLF